MAKIWIDEDGLHLRMKPNHSWRCDDVACIGCECDPECDEVHDG